MDHVWKTEWDIQNPSMIAKRYANACEEGTYLEEQAEKQVEKVKSIHDLTEIQRIYLIYKRLSKQKSPVLYVHFRALGMAIKDLMETFGDQYPQAKSYLTKLEYSDQELITLLE